MRKDDNMTYFSSKQEETTYYNQQASETEFLQWYKQKLPDYDKPSLTVDNVLIGYNKTEDQLKMLLIQRKNHPFKNSWALPGGFVNRNESAITSVIRETKEETHLHVPEENIEQLYTFSQPNRDPRGWIVSISHLAFISEEPTIAGDDAKEAGWFTMNVSDTSLHLTKEDTQIILDLKTGNSSGTNTLAFDHNRIILKAFHHIINQMNYEPRVLQVLGKEFTITEARKVFAQFLGINYKKIDHSNFKKGILNHLEEIGERSTGIGRPSKIYQLKFTPRIDDLN